MKVIENWKEATEEVAKAFIERHFPDEVYGRDTYWVADEVGGVFYVCDRFFGIERMIEDLELEATFDQMNDYYDLELELAMKGKKPPVNFKNYVKWGLILPD